MKRFHNTRTELTHLDSGERIYGWVNLAMPGRIVIEQTNEQSPEIDGRYRVTLSSAKSSSEFDATLSYSDEKLIVLLCPEAIRIQGPIESMRMRAPFHQITITTHDHFDVSMRLLDIGTNGVAIEGLDDFSMNDLVLVQIPTPCGLVATKARVVYCKADNRSQCYRSGLQFFDMNRVIESRWRQVLELNTYSSRKAAS